MRRVFSILVLLFFTLLSLTAQEERVYTFHSDIEIQTDGKIKIREEIKVYAAGRVFKRGITRALPVSRSDADGKSVKVSYKIDKVLQNGRKTNYFTERVDRDLVIYVGKEDVMLEPGYYTYEIFYSSRDQLGFFEGFDELYWNVNGTSDDRTDTVSCRITMPGDAKIINHKSFRGRYGSDSEDFITAKDEENSLYVEAANLESEELLTVAVSFTQGVVQQRGTTSYRLTFFDRFGLLLITIGLFIVFSIYYFFTWSKYGVDPPKPVVIPQFSPPEGISPATAGMLHSELYADDLVTSSIVNLAVKGYIRIKEHEVKGFLGLKRNKHYTLIKLKDQDKELPDEERMLVSKLFDEKQEVTISGSYNSSVENMMKSFRNSLRKQINPILREGLNVKFNAIPILLLLVYIFFLFYFSTIVPREQISSYIKATVISLSVSIPLMFILGFFIKKMRSKFLQFMIGLTLIAGSIDVFNKFWGELSVSSISFLIGFPLFVIAYFVYSYLIIRPSEKKLDHQAKIEGLKMYMDVAEEKQMQHFNPPEITPEVFEQLLPYAIALNMDKVWGEKFQQKFLSSLAGQNVYQPVWYTGTVMRPAIMGNTLKNSLTSNIRTSSVNPKSSGGSSWGSGSSGGGFSGGGGGGGRVGGW